MVWKSRWKLTPRSRPSSPTASNHRGMKLAWARGSMRQLYSVRKERLGGRLSPANSARPSSKTSLMTWLWRAEPNSLSASSARIAQAAGTWREPGKRACASRFSKGIRPSQGRNRNKPPKRVRTLRGLKSRARTSAAAAAWARGCSGRSSSRRRGRRAKPSASTLSAPARQAREALGLEHERDGGGAEGRAGLGQGTADVVDRQVLLAQGDHLLAHGIGLRGALGPFGGGQEEAAIGLRAELVAQHAEAAGGVAEALGDFVGGQRVDEVGAQGLVLAVRGVAGPQEVAGQICYLFSSTIRHIATMSSVF